MSEELVEHTKVIFGNTFAMYLKSHGYHWSVTGPDFVQLHDFYNDVYTNLWESLDKIAEQIRQLDAFAPINLQRILGLSTAIPEDNHIPETEEMNANLLVANEAVLGSLIEGYEMAESEKEYGLSNYLQDRISYHKELRWKLRSLIGESP